MSGVLLDTIVISELTKDEPDAHVISFLNLHQELWVSSIVLHELEFGLRLLPRGRRHAELQSAVVEFVTKYEDRLRSFGCAPNDQAARCTWATL